MELYMQNREHGRIILESIEHGLLIWPMIEENGEKECKLYDAFDKFAHIKGESLHQYYLRFTQLINDMNIYNMKLEQFQVNIKFLNSLPPEWSKFVTDVKLLRNSSNPRQQVTIHDERVAVQPVLGRQSLIAASTSGTRVNVSGLGGNNSGQERVDKVLLVEAQGSGKVLNEEELEFLADPGVVKGLVTQTVITHNATYQADDLDAYDYDCEDLSTAKAVLMANLSSYGSNVLSEKAQQIRPMLYDGSVIAKETNVISIADSEETLRLKEESRSKMLLKQSDPKVLEKKGNIKPINYAELNRLSEDFDKRFVHNKNCMMNKLSGYKLHTIILTLKDIFSVFDIDLLNETGLGYDSQMNKSDLNDVHVNESQVIGNSLIDSHESDGEDNQVNDRFKKSKGYHVVPPPYTGNYMPPKAHLSFIGLDDSVFKFSISETVTSVNETETSTSKTSKESLEKPKTVRSSAPIIEE
uniref:Integrase, catalytic region, zinc finger, CCHC-type, peptidase aspartic, catalytic n=1 Tax=Tanacetum cinerariifolium TaxID=118510 RepID=A0A6L2LHK3_TANCI|nr:hypothetical protein [Tanacetum cinerariifolium]